MRIPKSDEPIGLFWAVVVPVTLTAGAIISSSEVALYMITDQGQLPIGWTLAWAAFTITFFLAKRRICG